MLRRLIVNADDYGRTPAINEGILQAHRLGIVTSTTAMLNMPGVGDMLPQARQEPGLGLGVHLVFTAWRPILPPSRIPSLVDANGHFWEAHVWQSRLDHLNLDELWAEWQAQLALFHRVAGQPDHLDCHHFIHLYPPIFETYLKLAQQEEVPARVPFPAQSRGDDEAVAFGKLFGVAPEMIGSLLAADRALLREHPVRHPDHFCSAFYGEANLSLENLLSLLEALPAGVSEMMVHPGLADDALRTTSRYSWQREKELALLCHPAVRERVSALGISLADYGVLR